MTCHVLVRAPDGSPVASRALLDPGSSASFVSERLTQSVLLPRLSHGVRIMRIGGLSHESPTRTLTKFVVSPKQEQMMESQAGLTFLKMMSSHKLYVKAGRLVSLVLRLPLKPYLTGSLLERQMSACLIYRLCLTMLLLSSLEIGSYNAFGKSKSL